MFISRYEKKILKLIYQFWNERDLLTEQLKKTRENYKNISGNYIAENYKGSPFDEKALNRLCFEMKINKKVKSETKIIKREIKFRRAVDRLYGDSYLLQDTFREINLTDKGILAATDGFWIKTILRENKEWLLSTLIALIALAISIVSLFVKNK